MGPFGSGKYKDDYLLREELDERGRLRLAGEYVGPDFTFVYDGPELARAKRLTLWGTVLAVLCVLFPLCVSGAMVRSPYVMAPAVIAVIPAARLGIHVFRLRTARPPVTRRGKDGLETASVALGLMALALVSLVCQIVFYVREPFEPISLAVTAATVLQFLSALLAYRQKEYLEMEG